MISQDWPRVGHYVDFKDHDQMWEVGLIIQKRQHFIRIRNQGWGQRYDQTIFITEEALHSKNSRVQPFRSITRGYTGIRKTPSPREHWKFTREDHAIRLKKLEQFTDDIQKKSPDQLIQYLRGQHYCYIDFLMGNIYPSLQDLTKVYQYFLKHITLLHSFISGLLKRGLQKTFINQSLQVKQQDKWQYTYDNCYYQLTDAMYNIAGLQDRLSFFMKNNEDLIKDVVQIFEKHQYYISTHLQNSKLFQVITELIVRSHAVATDKQKGVKFPFSFVHSLMELFQVIQTVFMLEKLKDKGGQMFLLLFQVIKISFERVQPNDIKQVQIDRQFSHIFFHIRQTAIKYKQEEVLGRWREQTKMYVCWLFLRCDNLQKKIKGISKLKDIAQEAMKQEITNFSIDTFTQMLQTLKIFQQLFMQNDHIQLYKKSTELVGILYKYDLIGVEELCYVWNSSIHKHPLIIAQLYQFWIELAYVVQYEEIIKYAQTATITELQVTTENREYFVFFFDLIVAIINNNVNSSKTDLHVHQNIDRMVQEMINIAYHVLLQAEYLPYFSVLVVKYGAMVMESRYCEHLILDAYNRLAIKEQFKVCLQILHQVYVSHDRVDIHVPEGFRMRLIECVRRPEIQLNQIGYIFQIFNTIIMHTSRHNLTNKQFQILWQFFKGSREEYRQLFYTWILPLKSDQIHDTISSHLNLGFNIQLKKYILTDIISNPNYLNYTSLTKKELSIILQLLLEVNQAEDRIEKKKLMEGHRFLNRIKTVQLLHEGLLWQIFQQCKNQETVHYLNRYLIKFYFFFSPSLKYQLRKGRVDQMMEKVLGNIREGYARGNLKLVKHSLELLRGIFQTVRSDDRHFPCETPSPYKTKLDIRYLNNAYRIEIPQNQSINYLKSKVSQRLKLKPSSFKLVMKQQQQGQQLDYCYKHITVSFLRRSVLEVSEIGIEEQTLCKFVGGFINQPLEILFIQMLENQMLTSQVYKLIDQLELKLNKMTILQKIDSILKKYQAQGRNMLTIQIYYYLLEIKIFYRILEERNDLEICTASNCFKQMLNCMNFRVGSDEQINFLIKFLSLIIRIIKKATKVLIAELQFPPYLFKTIFQVSQYLVRSQKVSHSIKEQAIKIIDNCCSINEHLIQPLSLIPFYVSQENFCELIESIYLNTQIQYVRMILSDRFNKYLVPGSQIRPFEEIIERKLLNLLVDQMYFRIKDKEIQGKEGQNQGSFDFCILLAKTITVTAQQRIQHTQILNNIQGKQYSLFEYCLNFIQSLKLFQTQDFQWSYLLSGHFNILVAIYQHKPQLINSDIIHFVLQNCLGLGGNVYQPLCKKMEHISQAFKFLTHTMLFNKEVDHVRMLVQTLQPCQKLQLWRNSYTWSVNQKHEAKQLYRGLLNPGCICYMNSLLQQLYMIDEFRLSVLNLDLISNKSIQDQEMSQQQAQKTPAQDVMNSSQVLMLQGLKEIFLKLQFSTQNNINPTTFAKTLKTNQNRPMIKFNQQMDIDQFTSILFEKMERGVREKGVGNFIKKLFGGVYAHQIISKQCNHQSQREEEFYSISLDVKENIIKSFQSLVKTQVLDGGNKYLCEKCDKKVRAQKLQTIKQLPPYLILCLKRFQFDYDIDAKIKINDYCQFPQTLNLSPFSQQEIMKNQSDFCDQNQEKNDIPQDNFQFSLRGVVVHTGSADSGHYYSFIDNKKGRWFQFNDEDVLPFDFDKLPEEAFGCKSTNRYDTRTKNAYLMIYQRQQIKESTLNEEEILSRNEHEQLIERISRKNREIRKSQLVFSDDYEHIIRRLEMRVVQMNCPKGIETEWIKYQLSFYFLIKVRKDNLPYFMVFSKGIENQVVSNRSFCQLFLTAFTSPRFIEEIFTFNPIRQKCKVIAHIFYKALQFYYRNIKGIQLGRDQKLNKILSCLKAVFVVYGPISELLMTFRKFLQLLQEQDERQLLFKIIEEHNFEQVLLHSMFGISQDKYVKTESEKYCKSKTHDIDFLASVAIYGRRVHPGNLGQVGKVITFLLVMNKMFLEDPKNQQKEQRDFYVNNLNYMKRLLNNQPTIQSKITNLIIQSCHSRAIYYLYQTLKELDFHIKTLPIVEKALKDYESIKFRTFFLFLEQAANDNQLEIEHKLEILGVIERSYASNQKYFLESDTIHQWILRFASMNEQFVELLEAKSAFVQQIIDKIIRSPFPSVTDLAKKFKHHTNQKYLNRYLNILVSTDVREYDLNSQRMKIDYQDIRNMNYTTKEQYRTPDDHFDVGDRIQYFDIALGKWKKGKVVEYNFGQLTVKKQSRDESHFQVWEDSQKVRKIKRRVGDADISPCESDMSYESGQSDSPNR